MSGLGLAAGLVSALVFGLAARSGFATDRLVLIGIGVAAGAAALVRLFIVLTDPWNAAKALTWLSGSTYGRSFTHLLPLVIGTAVVVPLLLARTGQYLLGRALSADTVAGANEVMQEEISPIGDVRGTAAYKRLLLRQLLWAHFLRFAPGLEVAELV